MPLESISNQLKKNLNLQLLTMQAVITQLFFSMLKVIWQPYLVEHGVSFVELGTIQTVITIFTGAGSLLWGRLSDTYGRKPIHIASMLARIIAVTFAYTATDWIGFLGFGVFIGLSASWNQTNPVTTILVSESVEEEKMGTAFSIYTSAGTLLAVIASPLGGFLAANQGYQIIFISCILGELFNTVMTQSFLNETLKTNSQKQPQYNLLSLITPEKGLLPFYMINILSMFSWSVAFSNLNAILVEDYGLTVIQLGLMASAFSLSWGISMTPSGVLIDRHPRRQFLLASRLLFLVIALGYLLSRSFTVFMMLQVINGLAHGLGVPSYTAMVLTRVNREGRGSLMAKLSTLPQVISVPAPIIG
jgi:MFS family permease